ncbi:MAG: hypothetical protein AAF581_14030 [Planctomycetota bacterium]
MPSKFLPVLLAVVVTYAATSFFTATPTRQVFGGTVDSGGTHLILATGKLQNLEADALYVMDERSHKLAVYLIRAKKLELHSMRDCSYDFQLTAFGEQSPTVGEVKDVVRKKKIKTP